MPKPISPPRRLRLTQDWLDSRDAARELGVQPQRLTDDIRPLITHQSRSLTGARSARGVGWAYAREDVARCKVIMACLGCKALRAAQILFAIRRLDAEGQLRYIAEQLELSLEEQFPSYKRRRQ